MNRLADLSTASQSAFVAALDGIYEHSPWVAERAWHARPFATLAALHAALARAVAESEPAAQLALARAHPELAGRAAIRGELTALSRREQGGAGLDQCSSAEFSALTRLNAAYVEKFGFPFIIAVRGMARSDIIEAFEQRLGNTREQEMRECIRQIDHIALIRLRERVSKT